MNIILGRNIGLTDSGGDHNHTVSLNDGVMQTTLDNTPRSLSVGTLIFIGY